jgi:UDP-3-O-[3-hydroxymyristoyl] glucosamine N-acyltransferase
LAQPIAQLCHPKLAKRAEDLVYATNLEALAVLNPQGPTLALVDAALEAELPESLTTNPALGWVAVQRPRLALARFLEQLAPPVYHEAGIHPAAFIHPTATVEDGVSIGAYCTVGPHCHVGAHSVLHPRVHLGTHVRVGQHCTLHVGVVVGDHSQLGNKVVVQPNAVVGGEGFSYVTPQEARHETRGQETPEDAAKAITSIERIASTGWVVLEDEVEVGAGTTIDRGTLYETRIGKGTKLDNLVQIGHNNRIGQHCFIVSQVGIAGSCTIGNGVVIAGQAGLADHLTIGDGAIIMASSGVMRDVEAGSHVVGLPAQPRKQYIENVLLIGKLKEMRGQFKAMQKQVEAMKTQADQWSTLLEAAGVTTP